MKIRDLSIKSKAILAPMAGYTDKPFRKICKEMGAGIVYSEFVSSEGLIRQSERTEFYLINDASEHPFGIQIFGHNPDSMADSAKYIEKKFNPDIIDINMGCPVRKVVKKGAGAALLKDLPLLEKIAQKVVAAVKTPVTGKIRIGWDHTNYVAEDVAKILADSGIEAITIHPRTVSDGYGGKIQPKFIKKIKQLVDIPVIGNGDILSAADAEKMLEVTGCDGIMIGRGAIGNPWIFSNINRFFSGKAPIIPTLSDKATLCLDHLEREINHRGADQANKIMRKFFGGYFKGFPGASKLRHRLVTAADTQATIQILKAVIEDNQAT